MIREDDALRAALEERLNQLAEKSDLIRRRDLDGDDRGLEKLDVGQYYLDIDLDGPFPKLCFIGRMNNGCPYEHQIIPFDTHCFELVANTGIDHEHLELKRLIDWARLNVPASLSPITHLAADATERMIDDKRRACINAMNEEGIQNFFGQVEKAFIS